MCSLRNVFSSRMRFLIGIHMKGRHECLLSQYQAEQCAPSLVECVFLQNVFSYRMCSPIECVLLQNVFSHNTKQGNAYHRTAIRGRHRRFGGTSLMPITLLSHSMSFLPPLFFSPLFLGLAALLLRLSPRSHRMCSLTECVLL